MRRLLNTTSLLIAFGVSAVGCNTPKSICYDTVDGVNQMWERCGIPYRVDLVLADGTPASCEDVNQVNNPGQLLQECIPWTQEVSCEELYTYPGVAPRDPVCDFTLFEYFVY